mmetsp:Transcript_34872/g.79111  ORF Transcript_34872/g.79111 Transcript_34872/m.79111 type:complete len:114 (-) Transcript_34872:26-367(-)
MSSSRSRRRGIAEPLAVVLFVAVALVEPAREGTFVAVRLEELAREGTFVAVPLAELTREYTSVAVWLIEVALLARDAFVTEVAELTIVSLSSDCRPFALLFTSILPRAALLGS